MIHLINEIQFIITALMLTGTLRRRRLFPLRLLAGIALIIAFALLCAVLRTDHEGLWGRILLTLVQYASTLPLLLLCFDEDADLLLKTWCTSVAVKEIMGAVYPFLQFLAGVDSAAAMTFFSGPDAPEWLQWLEYFGIHVAGYYGLCFLLGRHYPRTASRNTRWQSAWLSIGALVILSVLGSVLSHYRAESQVLYVCGRFFALSVSVFVLLTYAGIELRSQAGEEIAAMERVIAEERKQYQQMKENIDIINMRCHDLKHQLDDFSGRLTDREIAELREAMEIYDSSIRTGCEALDVVLYLHQLTCKKEGIILTCLANGEALSFMRTRHIYALFNNAIGNAIEAARKVTDPEKRVIGITVAARDQQVDIEIVNYFDGTLPAAGAARTTKEDRAHHGFGTQSMQYIVSQYGGTLTTEARHGIYTLSAAIPIPASS